MCAVPNVAVFCSSLTSWFSGMVLTYFMNDFEMVPAAPIIIIITVFNDWFYNRDGLRLPCGTNSIFIYNSALLSPLEC
jgi:hypothetical protein